MQNIASERRSLFRLPFNFKFHVRDSRGGRQTYPANSCDIHPCGARIETEAPVAPKMLVEIWPEDFDLGNHYAHGEVCWVTKVKGGKINRCGITFKRRIDWQIPLPLLSKSYEAAMGAGPFGCCAFILDGIIDGVFSVDHKWRITAFNRAAEQLTGWKREDAIGKSCQEVFHANACDKEAVLAESVRTGKPVENRSVFITHATGKRIGVTISAMPLHDQGGRVVGGVQMFRGVKAVLDRDIILDNIVDGVFTVDTRWRITSFNRAAELVTGMSRADAIGKSCSEVFHASICGKSCAIAHGISTGKPQANRCIYIRNVDGAKVPVSICASPLYDNSGTLIGGVETFRDLRAALPSQNRPGRCEKLGSLISKSPSMKAIFDTLPQIAESDSNVLILGSSGTGKELVARTLHDMSKRRTGPFVAVSCGTLPDLLLESELFGCTAGADATGDRQGRFAAANGGTLLLDEIGHISPAMQVRLLRVLEAASDDQAGSNRGVQAGAMIIAATNRDLEKEMREGRFREDLFSRLSGVKITLPPLRERAGDIPFLANRLVEKLSAEQGRDIGGISDEALGLLMTHDFPGNIRELQHIIEYAFIFCPGGMIEPQHLPPSLFSSFEKGLFGAIPQQCQTLEEMEKKAICAALRRNNWKRMATCKELGISKDTLRRKISKYGFSAGEEKESAKASQEDVEKLVFPAARGRSMEGSPRSAGAIAIKRKA